MPETNTSSLLRTSTAVISSEQLLPPTTSNNNGGDIVQEIARTISNILWITPRWDKFHEEKSKTDLSAEREVIPVLSSAAEHTRECRYDPLECLVDESFDGHLHDLRLSLNTCPTWERRGRLVQGAADLQPKYETIPKGAMGGCEGHYWLMGKRNIWLIL